MRTLAGKPSTKVSAESMHPVEWLTEENFKFRLSAFREPLLAWMRCVCVCVCVCLCICVRVLMSIV